MEISRDDGRAYKKAIITGITGQDGGYLAKLLCGAGYEVVGIIRSHASYNSNGLAYLGIQHQVKLIECDLLDLATIIKIISTEKPNEIYNLAAQSSVGMSFLQPLGTISFNIMSVVNLLEAIKIIDKNIKFYQASSSEMFGEAEILPITEKTPFCPLSPYAISKTSAHWIATNYRQSYNMFICCGILFNHESCMRRDDFIIKKLIKETVLAKKK